MCIRVISKRGQMVKKLALLMVLCLATLTAGAASGDYNIENTFTAEGSIQMVDVSFEQEFQFDDEGYHYHHAEITLCHDIGKWLSLGTGYRQIYELTEEEWELEKRTNLIASLSKNLGMLSFSNKNKLEIRIREGKDTAWRYRSKFSLSPMLKVTSLRISPYLADEIFIDEERLGRNRLSIGIKLNLMSELRGDLFGMIQSDKKDGTWKNTNVLGTKITAAF